MRAVAASIKTTTMEQTDIKNKIWSNLDRLRTDRNFSGFHDTRLLELIRATLGEEKLAEGIYISEFFIQMPSYYSR